MSLEELKSHHNTLIWPSVDHTAQQVSSHQQVYVDYTSVSRASVLSRGPLAFSSPRLMYWDSLLAFRGGRSDRSALRLWLSSPKPGLWEGSLCQQLDITSYLTEKESKEKCRGVEKKKSQKAQDWMIFQICSLKTTHSRPCTKHYYMLYDLVISFIST